MSTKKKTLKKNKNIKICIIAVIPLFIIIAIVVAVVVVLSGKHITLEDVKEYCRKNSYSTSKIDIDTSRLGNDHLIETSIVCSSSISTINYYTFYDLVPENWFTDSIPNDGTAITLGEGKNYLKIYYNPDKGATSGDYRHDYVVYGIMDGKEMITVVSPDEATARRVLIEIGYPDKEWYTGQR